MSTRINVIESAILELNNLAAGKPFKFSVPVQENDSDIVLNKALVLGKALAHRVIAAHNADTLQERARLWVEARDIAEALVNPTWGVYDKLGYWVGVDFRVDVLAIKRGNYSP